MDRTGTGAACLVPGVLCYSNADGAPFVVLWELFLAAIWLAPQPSVQIYLAPVIVTLFAQLKLIDAARDARRTI